MSQPNQFLPVYKNALRGHTEHSYKIVSLIAVSNKNMFLVFNEVNLNYGYSLLLTLSFINDDLKLNEKKSYINSRTTDFLSHYFFNYYVINQPIVSRLKSSKRKLPSGIINNTKQEFNSFSLIKKAIKTNNFEKPSICGSFTNGFISWYFYDFKTKETIILNSLLDKNLPSKHMPFVISIDSEFVDKNNDAYSIYENIRINIPLSVGVQVTFFNNKNHKIYKTYVFDEQHYHYLKQNTKDNYLKDSIEYIAYKSSKHYTYEHYSYDDLVKINDDNILMRLLYKELINNICKNESIFPSLYFVPPKCLKNFRNKEIASIPVLFYFSVKDLKYFFSNEIYDLIERYIYTLRHVTFDKFSSVSPFGFLYEDEKIRFIFKIKLIDLFGINSNGLANLAECTNVKMERKNSLENYKVDMREAIIQHPNIFMEYQYGDVNSLFIIYCNHVKMIHSMYKELNIDFLPTMFSQSKDNELKQTVGSTTALLFEHFIYSKHPILKPTIDKLGIYIKRQELQYKNIALIKGIEMGSSKYLIHLKGSAIEGAFVSGGRCCNETPEIRNFANVLDIDFESCYGNGLRTLLYPIGRPHVLRNPDGGFVCSLGKFLRCYKNELIPGCWYTVVGTKEEDQLGFDFDLIISKLITSQNIQQKINQPDSMPHNMHISGSQAIFTRQIKHGIITDDTLDIINNVATNNEKNELYKKIYVICACFYPKRMQCHSVEEFSARVTQQLCAEQGKNKKKLKQSKHILNGSKDDNAPMYWYGIEMEEFVGKLINKRKELKILYKQTSKSEFNALQNQLKTIINTLYGVIASRFFPISNLTFANNVTSKARSQSWLLSKCFNTKQIITDGGFYEINKVFNVDSFKKKPGFGKLYKVHISENLNDCKHFMPLGRDIDPCIEWSSVLQNLKNNYSDSSINDFNILVDKFANQQFKKFCNFFKVAPKYNLEHKINNTSLRAVTVGRGHYYLESILNQDIFKIRGTQPRKDNESIESPIYNVLKNKLHIGEAGYEEIVLPNICYSNKSMIKRFNYDSIRKKLGSKYKDLDYSLHSSVINKKVFVYNLDCGKFENETSYKNLNSSYGYVLSLSFLDNKCISAIDNNTVIINANAFWTNQKKRIKELTQNNKLMRLSKNHLEYKNELVANAIKIDSNFPLSIQDLESKSAKTQTSEDQNLVEVIDTDDNFSQNFDDFDKF